MPATHSPVSVPHLMLLPSRQVQPSSTSPSQFSSLLPSQTSAPGSTSPSQSLHTPATQVSTPRRHTPTLSPQGRVKPSSIDPLQSSSRLLQVSDEGPIAPMHAPNTPPMQTCWPATHSPSS